MAINSIEFAILTIAIIISLSVIVPPGVTAILDMSSSIDNQIDRNIKVEEQQAKISNFNYSSTNNTLSFNIENTGSNTIDIKKSNFFINGELVNVNTVNYNNNKISILNPSYNSTIEINYSSQPSSITFVFPTGKKITKSYT